jgi:hypothetical protein
MDAHGLTVYDVLPEVEFFLEHQSTDVNGLIYATFEIIAERFLESVGGRIIKYVTSDYEIFTNYLDSSLQFDDPQLQDRYEEWRAQFK